MLLKWEIPSKYFLSYYPKIIPVVLKSCFGIILIYGNNWVPR